jgi:hypothetical protein
VLDESQASNEEKERQENNGTAQRGPLNLHLIRGFNLYLFFYFSVDVPVSKVVHHVTEAVASPTPVTTSSRMQGVGLPDCKLLQLNTTKACSFFSTRDEGRFSDNMYRDSP